MFLSWKDFLIIAQRFIAGYALFSSLPSDKSLGYYQLSLPGQPVAHDFATKFHEEPKKKVTSNYTNKNGKRRSKLQ